MKKNLTKQRFVTLMLTSTIFWVTGCASIITSGDRTIPVSSDPAAATVVVYDSDNDVVANSITPTKIKLKKGNGYFQGAEYRMVISKEGYQSKEIEIHHNVNGWYFGNFFIGGLLGFVVVDPLTGGMWVLKPDKIDVQLPPSTSSITESSIPVVSLTQLSPVQRERMVPISAALHNVKL